MNLTQSQKQDLLEHGFVQMPGIVPRERIHEALRAVNHSLGEGMPPEEVRIYRSRSYCPELQRTPAILDLYHQTPIRKAVGSVLDLNQLEPVDHGQIALRFPGADRVARPAHPHIDGMHSPDNGVKQGTIANFTALVGVLLSDLPDENAGNFTVWPGTHRLNAEYFRGHGAEALLNGMPPVTMPKPKQITGKAGDAILAHYLLAHGVTPNISPFIRYAVFFRLRHASINETNWQQSMEDPWLHWPGMRGQAD